MGELIESLYFGQELTDQEAAAHNAAVVAAGHKARQAQLDEQLGVLRALLAQAERRAESEAVEYRLTKAAAAGRDRHRLPADAMGRAASALTRANERVSRLDAEIAELEGQRCKS